MISARAYAGAFNNQIAAHIYGSARLICDAGAEGIAIVSALHKNIGIHRAAGNLEDAGALRVGTSTSPETFKIPVPLRRLSPRLVEGWRIILMRWRDIRYLPASYL